MAMLDHDVAPYLEFGATPDKVCLCGALAGEMMVLPPELRTRIDHFFKSHQSWLAGILKRGAERVNSGSPRLPPKRPGLFSVPCRERSLSSARPEMHRNCAML